MDYIKIRLCSDLSQSNTTFQETIEEMFQSMSPRFALSERTWKPQMDIYETPEEIIVLATVAGAEKEDLEIEVNTRAIRISGKRSTNIPTEQTKYRLAEIQYGTFERVLYLPAPIDTDVVSASYNNGFLQIRMVKQPTVETRKISIDDEA